jgi:hypothetical protein
MSFERGDKVWIPDSGIGFSSSEKFVECVIVKKVMPHHGISYDKDSTKWYVSTPYSDFSTPYHESDLKSWMRQKLINDLGI